MLDLQDRMNTKVHPQWIEQGYEWYRAAWIECAELMDHYGYKWWKKQEHDLEQVQLEVIDIWHFGMSALFRPGVSTAVIADEIVAALEAAALDSSPNVLLATEALAGYSLQTRSFSVPLFWNLMQAAQLDFDTLYRRYIGKNVLNFFRQDNGYKDGSYIKIWGGEEDNVHLMAILAELNSEAEDFADQVYRGLSERYPG
ncbi:dUTP diphosphatase [Spongiibacter sp. KMU-158]|uniref:dUTP diphosphatase n=1 Tax=Spongiibacter pelagi TaxID=2760804 RepID=A0A927C4D0_9GAMM|nr:dUTP diphosphatase [Spongiibacter pelagi]MBD2859647.1 dUTP diphosphatase [Spongiibacter pelagi]